VVKERRREKDLRQIMLEAARQHVECSELEDLFVFGPTPRPGANWGFGIAGDGLLTNSGEKKSETGDKERRFTERYYGRFERSVPIDDVDQDKVGASFKDGVLTVTLAKLPSERQKLKRIAINSK
jgi:hypothetical protein